MLCESRHENLKILMVPLNVQLSSLKSTGTVGYLRWYRGLIIWRNIWSTRLHYGFAQLFSKLIIKKSLQMLGESRHENLKILSAPLSIKLSSLKSTGTLCAVVLGFNNLYFITKIDGHIQ